MHFNVHDNWLIRNRNRNLQTCKAPLESQVGAIAPLMRYWWEFEKREEPSGDTYMVTHHRKPLKSLARKIGWFIGTKSTKLAADEKKQHQAYE